MKTFANCCFAPIRKSEFDFFVRSAGHFRLARIDRGSCKKAHFPEIFWAVDGAGYFMLNGKQHLLKPGYVWYYPPGSEHFFFPAGDFFEYRWLTIDGVSARTLFEGLGFRPGARYAGECPETLFRKLELEIASPDRKRRLASLSLAFSILTLAVTVTRRTGARKSCAEEARLLIEADFSDPDLNVARLAELLHVNRVSLSRSFSRLYGTSLSGYLAGCRIRAALDYLKNTALPVAEIAALCGFSSVSYFSRVISRATGRPPGKIRFRASPAEWENGNPVV